MKRGRKSKAEKDSLFISRILNTKLPWPWQTKVTLPEIERSFYQRLPLNEKVVKHYYDILYKEWLTKKEGGRLSL